MYQGPTPLFAAGGVTMAGAGGVLARVGGLAMTGFDAELIGLAGAVLVVVGLCLLRLAALRRARKA